MGVAVGALDPLEVVWFIKTSLVHWTLIFSRYRCQK